MRTFLTRVMLLLWAAPAWAQPSAVISTNRVEATVQTDGRLFTNGTDGKFLIPGPAGNPAISLFNGAGFWVGGWDSALNLQLSGTLSNKSDFQPGTIDPLTGTVDALSLGKIWKVTRQEIEAHRADFADNGVIDQPIPSIFGWPARGNPFFSDFNNGQILPLTANGLAGFYDEDANAVYNPQSGDYPVVEVRGCALIIVPEEMMWFVTNDIKTHPVSGAAPVGVELQTTVFSYGCDANSPAGNTIFVSYKMINRRSSNLDSAYIGIYTDFSVGNNTDDFFGCDTSLETTYAYNGDANDENGFGQEAPVVSVDFLYTPLKVVYDPEPALAKMPIASTVAFNATQTLTSLATYQLLSGKNSDGSPVANNGIPFPGNPLEPGSASEITNGSIPGKRSVLTSFGPFQMQPGQVQNIVLAFSYTQKDGQSSQQNLNLLSANSGLLQDFHNNCYNIQDASAICTPLTVAVSGPASQVAPAVVFPNPATDLVTISHGNGIKKIHITTASGLLLHQWQSGIPQESVQIHTQQFPQGCLFAQITTPEGNVQVVKIVVMK